MLKPPGRTIKPASNSHRSDSRRSDFSSWDVPSSPQRIPAQQRKSIVAEIAAAK